ncbi:hypothetical protein GGR44_003049 [Sphingobium fontiphilum]|uniref:DUF3168 domain-containing protein n=1 Tax=Sphingobium fontiphilum TaxID=944425 RepID=A0A7W6DHF7_9SPHN|nr:hypothetical protein [Sphingobium fontiphilum]MBB3983361.1 hypothetical protein [Sphingobium fontiphilum]
MIHHAAPIGRPGPGLPARRSADPLPQLLRQLAARAGDACLFDHVASRPWCSAMFQGRRHAITLRLEGADTGARADALTTGLPDMEWSLSGHFVADMVVDERLDRADGVTLILSALTIEDW